MKKVVLGVGFCVVSCAFFILPNFAWADTNISGGVSTDTTWSPDGGVYIVSDGFTVSAGATLTILPGTIVKVKSFGGAVPTIYGKVIAHGTSELPIYFTSFWDDSVGGDTDSTPGSSGNRWPGLYFKSGSEGDFDHIDISDAGTGGYWGVGDFISLENDGGTLTIKNSHVHDNRMTVPDGGSGSMIIGNGIWNKNGALTVSDSNIENNSVGIVAESGSATISNNIIQNNGAGFDARGGGQLNITGNTFSNNGKTGSVDISKNFVHSGNTSTDKTNRGFEMSGTISNDTSLGSADLPLLFGSLIVNAGKTLTIEPGTIIKMNYYGASIDVKGNLTARGTADKKIYITSLRDDSVGGDTNGDGGASAPAGKDWASLIFEAGSKIDFDNVVLKYGGYNYNGEYLNVAAAIYQRGAEFAVVNSDFENNEITDIFQDAGTTTIDHCESKNSKYDIFSRGGSIKISQSNIGGNSLMSIYNEGGPQIDARNNWWGDVSGPHNVSTTTPTGSGGKVAGNVLYIPFLDKEPAQGSGEVLGVSTGQINPVIIVPGIMGSAEHDGKLVIDPILHTYDDLIATLEANGYVEGKTLFPFPYEWRDSNVQSAVLLKDKINEIKTDCLVANLENVDCTKVDLVAHSMGGLVARQYIEYGGYQNDIDQLIFLGTPHHGSPQAYLQWEGGSFPKDTLSQIVQLVFNIEATEKLYSSMFSYIHNRPISSVQELLPTFNYLKDKDTGVIRVYPNNYPQNIFLEALNSNTGMQKLLNSGIKIKNIVGDTGANTVATIRVVKSENSVWADGEPDGFEGSVADHGLEMNSGDGTVTTYGSNLDNSIQNEIAYSTDHKGLPSAKEESVFNILTGKTITNGIHRGLIQKLLSIQLHSPIDMLVTAPDGKRMGKNFATGEEYNEIPGAFYSGFQTDEEYITIPNPIDGEYKIEVQGTGNGGNYGVVTNYVSDNSNVSKEYSGTIKPGEVQETSIITGGTGNSLSLEIKTDETVSAPKSNTNSSGSTHHDVGEVLGASTSLDDQTALQLKFIELLNEMVKLLQLYAKIYNNH
jgi:parallel beta-helix repeat protein